MCVLTLCSMGASRISGDANNPRISKSRFEEIGLGIICLPPLLCVDICGDHVFTFVLTAAHQGLT